MARENIKNKASKAMTSLLKYIKSGNIPVKLGMSLFDKLVRPILSYGSEIWALPNNIMALEKRDIDKIYGDNATTQIPGEKICLQFYRYLLGVHRKTSTLAIRGELGCFPLYITNIIQLLKYWQRLSIMSSDSLLGESYRVQQSLVNSRSQCWLMGIKNILEKYNLQNCLTQPEFFDPNYMKNKMEGEYREVWKEKLMDDDRKIGGNKRRV